MNVVIVQGNLPMVLLVYAIAYFLVLVPASRLFKYWLRGWIRGFTAPVFRSSSYFEPKAADL